MGQPSLKWQMPLALTRIYVRSRGVQVGRNLCSYGFPLIHKHPDAKIVLGHHVVLTSLSSVNPAGVNHRVILAAPSAESRIVIGDHSGMSGGVIYAAKSVTIGRYVNIGVNVCIYDTDMHSLDWQERRDGIGGDTTASPVVIEEDVWIGANVLVLKGVIVGRGAVIGAGSVVTKNIPAFTVWAGNPAVCVKKLEAVS